MHCLTSDSLDVIWTPARAISQGSFDLRFRGCVGTLVFTIAVFLLRPTCSRRGPDPSRAQHLKHQHYSGKLRWSGNGLSRWRASAWEWDVSKRRGGLVGCVLDQNAQKAKSRRRDVDYFPSANVACRFIDFQRNRYARIYARCARASIKPRASSALALRQMKRRSELIYPAKGV